MSLAAVFDILGQQVMPTVATAAFPDTMDIKAEVNAAGPGGGRIKSRTSTAYEAVPCTYKPLQVETRLNSADKLVSLQQYMVTFPTHHQGERVDIDPKTHSLTVLERGNEPEKVFKIISIRDKQGVIFEAICTKEN
jgi:hypothetical protein